MELATICLAIIIALLITLLIFAITKFAQYIMEIAMEDSSDGGENIICET